MKAGLAAVMIGAAALAALGLVLVILPAPAGWFAYQPMGDFGFVGGAQFVPVPRMWGLGILAIAAVIGAFATGWILGRVQGRQNGESDSASDSAPEHSR